MVNTDIFIVVACALAVILGAFYLGDPEPGTRIIAIVLMFLCGASGAWSALQLWVAYRKQRR